MSNYCLPGKLVDEISNLCRPDIGGVCYPPRAIEIRYSFLDALSFN